MDEKVIMQRLIEIIEQFVEDTDVLQKANRNTHLIHDLAVNSAWIVDFMIKIEDAFDIEISDDDADSLETIGDAVDVIRRKIETQGTAAA